MSRCADQAALRSAASLLILSICLTSCARGPESFDLVLRSGRVIDPETNLDAVRDIGIRGDTIASVSTVSLAGARVIDVRGLVVAPGFIDLHQHAQTNDGYRLMALDGVTTALELEVGVRDLRRFVETRRGKSLIHFGAAGSYLAARVAAWEPPLPMSAFAPDAGVVPQPGPATSEPADSQRLQRILDVLRGQIDAGALGIGMGLEYAPGATRHEVVEVFNLAASRGVPVYVHARSGGRLEPGSSIEAVLEVIGAAAVSGAGAHIVHINSTCLREAPQCLSMIAGSRARGIDVTVEAYPYTAGMTFINSALFNPGWREKRGLEYQDLELPESGERLTRERFDALRAAGEPRLVLIHNNPEDVVDAIIADPLVIVASDGLRDHPRGAGTHARVLARYVRDRKTIDVKDAIRKMALMPAQRLERTTPAARRLGRVQKGARADLVVFDADSVQDRASFRSPSEPSVGVRYLLVAGTPVVDEGRIVEGVAPGRPLMRSEAASQVH